MNKTQKEEIKAIFSNIKKSGELDYVTAWYKKAKTYIHQTDIQVAYVSTNSICQGLQAGLLWSDILSQELEINFAHTTFKWTNAAKGKAAVYYYRYQQTNQKEKLFTYNDINGEASVINVKYINNYLTDYKNIFNYKTKPICDVNEMSFGNMPADGGKLLFTNEEKICIKSHLKQRNSLNL